MMNQLITLVLDESKWLPASMAFAIMAIAIMLYRQRQSVSPPRHRVLAAMNLFFGITIGSMAFGHLLAVTIKLLLGTLEGSVPLFYLIGIALAVPAFWLIIHTRRVLTPSDGHARATLVLNAWLAITLLTLGFHNLPLAAPAFFNIGYHLHSRRVVGWVIVSLAVVVNVGLFIGSLIFMASGQSFEQFRGIE